MIKQNDSKIREIYRLRKFGIVMALVLSLIGAVMLSSGKTVWPYLFGVAAGYLICGLLLPGLLIPVEWLWMKLAGILGYVMTRLILTVTFYLVITPIGLLRQLFGNDPLNLKIDKKEESYWIPVDPKGPVDRPEKMY